MMAAQTEWWILLHQSMGSPNGQATAKKNRLILWTNKLIPIIIRTESFSLSLDKNVLFVFVYTMASKLH